MSARREIRDAPQWDADLVPAKSAAADCVDAAAEADRRKSKTDRRFALDRFGPAES